MSTPAIASYGFDAGTQQEEIQGKFLQLNWQGKEYLLFATFAVHRYHNQILAHFLQEHALPHRWLSREKLEFDVPGLKVVGGGRFLGRSRRQVLELWDDSQAYGRFDDDGLAQTLAASGLWRGFSVKIS